MTLLSKEQLRCIKTMIGKLRKSNADAVADEDAVVLGFTMMRTKHVSEMSAHEAKLMIKHLKDLDPEEVAADKMRKKLIKMAYLYKALPANASNAQKLEVMRWLDGWCREYGHGRKALNSYTPAQLPKLVTQFEIMVQKDVLKK